MKNILNTIKEFLLKLYLLPVNGSVRLAMSVRNRILPGHQHLKGFVFAINNLTSQDNFGKTVIDVGCFDGSSSIFFLKELKDVNVIGFEPNILSYDLAVKKTENYTSIKVENYALSDFCGVTDFYITDNLVSSSINPVTGSDKRFSTTQIVKVNTITLDEYLLNQNKEKEKILAIKLDVQGHEINVLKGAENTLKRTLFVITELSNHESYKGGAQYFEIDQLMRERGFVLQNIYAPYSYTKYMNEYDAVYINSMLV